MTPPRPPRALCLCLAALVWPLPSAAQHRPRRPHPAPAPAPVATVVRVVRTSLRDARAELPRHLDAIARCLRDAAARDPVRLSRHAALTVAVHLTPQSRADTVEVIAERLPPGLSACLDAALNTWAQRPYSRPDAFVQLRIAAHPP